MEDTDDGVLDAVDAAYREKYGRRYPSIVDTINDEEAVRARQTARMARRP